MDYIWINPVVDCMIPTETLDEFLAKSGCKRIVCRRDWGQVVKDKYKAALSGTEGTVVDMRCPMACDLVRGLKCGGRLGEGLVFPNVEPILIHCAREISGREDLKGKEKLIVTPCRSLADLGNSLKLGETRFLTWNDFLKEKCDGNGTNRCEICVEVEKRQAETTPIPPGFFKGLEVKQESLTEHVAIENYFLSGRWKNVRLTELLYCQGGCHNGDGVVKE